MSKDFEKLQRSPRHVARWQKAQQDLLGGRAELALDAYRELLKKFPGTAQLWFEMSFAAAKQLNFVLADQACQRAAELAPADVSLLVLIGQQYHQLRRLDKARACFERAVAADPSSIHAQLSLADWYERERRLDDAWTCVETCVARHPLDAQVLCVKALLLHRKGQNEEAETLLRDLIKRGSQDTNVKYTSRHQLAVVLDELGQYAEAMHWLIEAKAVLAQTANVAKIPPSRAVTASLFWAATRAAARRCWNKSSARIPALPPLMNPWPLCRKCPINLPRWMRPPR
jgi:tetratricopeptide (TPR) repeat protein